jgi:hypothetical protein
MSIGDEAAAHLDDDIAIPRDIDGSVLAPVA